MKRERWIVVPRYRGFGSSHETSRKCADDGGRNRIDGGENGSGHDRITAMGVVNEKYLRNITRLDIWF